MTVPTAGPMSGVRVLEMVGLGPAPFATRLMSELGATVIRVDRDATPPPSGIDPMNHGRPALRLDLRRPETLDAVRRLLPSVDAVIDPFRPGAMDRLGLSSQVCLEINPALVYLTMTGWGTDGPLATTAGHDINYLALSGGLHELSDGTRPPFPPLNLLADYAGGSMFLVVGLLAGVMHARATGQGQVVDVAMLDGVATMYSGVDASEAEGMWDPDPTTNPSKGSAPHYNVYETADGRHLAVGAVEAQFYRQLVAGLGLADAGLDQWDQATWPQQKARIAEVVRGRTLAEWTEVFEGTDACVTPVLTRQEAAAHPHLVARQVYEQRDGASWARPAPRFSATPASRSAATEAGDVRCLLHEAGVDDSLVDQLLGSG